MWTTLSCILFGLQALGLGAHSHVPGDESLDTEISIPKNLHPGPESGYLADMGGNSDSLSSSLRDPETLICDVLVLSSCLGAEYMIATQC